MHAAEVAVFEIQFQADLAEFGMHKLPEMECVDEATAREAFRLAAAKLGIPTAFVQRQVM